MSGPRAHSAKYSSRFGNYCINYFRINFALTLFLRFDYFDVSRLRPTGGMWYVQQCTVHDTVVCRYFRSHYLRVCFARTSRAPRTLSLARILRLLKPGPERSPEHCGASVPKMRGNRGGISFVPIDVAFAHKRALDATQFQPRPFRTTPKRYELDAPWIKRFQGLNADGPFYV